MGPAPSMTLVGAFLVEWLQLENWPMLRDRRRQEIGSLSWRSHRNLAPVLRITASRDSTYRYRTGYSVQCLITRYLYRVHPVYSILHVATSRSSRFWEGLSKPCYKTSTLPPRHRVSRQGGPSGKMHRKYLVGGFFDREQHFTVDDVRRKWIARPCRGRSLRATPLSTRRDHPRNDRLLRGPSFCRLLLARSCCNRPSFLLAADEQPSRRRRHFAAAATLPPPP